MNSEEPINLTEWMPCAADRHQGGRLFTCGRPGRGTYDRRRVPVDNDTINRWVRGLPEPAVVHLVSLLGQKSDGYSEFGYYPFRSAKECGTKPTFQEWLEEHYPRRFIVHEFPTVDAKGIKPTVSRQAQDCLLELLEGGNTVVLVDSMGKERTARICEKIAYKKRVSSGP